MAPSRKPTNRNPSASERIPPLVAPLVSDKAKKTLDILEKFVEGECIPIEPVFQHQLGTTTEQRFNTHPHAIEELKTKAKQLGLWNLFLPRNHFKEGAGFSNLEYGLMAEVLARSPLASEATNCAAPDTGNMEVIAKYGTEKQKRTWLDPLLNGKIRSAFLMTEPDVASSDATNIRMTITKQGGSWVLNGSKWWSSGAGDPRCAVYIVMGKSSPGAADAYRQQSVILVPADTPGITVHRMLSVFGYDDAPHGHGHISFNNVRVPDDHMVLGEGRGFEIIQGRLGPGRIHHAMRSIGGAERALDLFITRINDPNKVTFGAPLSQNQVMLARIAECRIDIDAARLVVCNAAAAIDNADAAAAKKEIAQAKVLVPQALLKTLDYAIQAFGAQGVCQDTPLAAMWANARTMRIVDGPDEVHMLQLGRNENKRGPTLIKKLEAQKAAQLRQLSAHGLTTRDPLYIGKSSTGPSKL